MSAPARLAAALAVCGALAAAGCLSRPYAFNAARAERYIAAHPALPGERAEALRAGRVTAGMTREEVRLCLGDPHEVRRVERGGQTLDVWEYVRRIRPDDGLPPSGMWDRPVPLARVYFDPEERVLSCRTFEPSQPVPHGPGGRPAPQAPPTVAKRAVEMPSPAEPVGGFEGWPELELTGVVIGAGEPLAIINGRELAEGGSIGDVRILEITARGVRLQRGETVRFLRTGGTTRP